MRKAITGLAIVALVAGVALVAISLSQEPSAIAQEAEQEVFFQPLDDLLDDLVEDQVITQDQRDKVSDALEERMVRFGRGFRGTPHLDTIAEVLEIDVDVLAEQLRDGSTIADIAGDQTEAVTNALVDEYTARINDAVADGRLTEEKAEEVRTTLTERVESMVNREHHSGVVPFGTDHKCGPRDSFHGRRGFDFFNGPGGIDGYGFRGGFSIDTAAEALGLELDELLEQLADGSSLADIAEAQGVGIQDIVDAVLADLDEKLDDLVGEERLTRERADQIRKGLSDNIESMINREMPGIGGFRFEFKFDRGEGLPHFRGPGHEFPFPEGFFGDPDDLEGEGFFHFHGPDGELPFPEGSLGDPDDVNSTGASA